MSDTFAEWQKEATHARVPVVVCLDRARLYELQQTEEKLRSAEIGREGLLPDNAIASMRARVETLREEIRKASKTFIFESIGQHKWKRLEAEHPATEEQIEILKDAGMVPRHNPDTFRIAAVARTCVEPGLTEEQAKWIHDEFPEAVFNKIWDACSDANVLGGRDPFDPVSVTRNGFEKKSKPRSASVSRGASS